MADFLKKQIPERRQLKGELIRGIAQVESPSRPYHSRKNEEC
jgi:hypothetical protein